MNFIEELKWRGMLHDCSPGIDKELAKGMITGYIGFDPTAKSLTIGNYVQIMLLDLFQRSGHKPIFLLGGATGRIGDPSGKDTERELLSYDELDQNLLFQKQQAAKFLNFEEGINNALMLNNLDFYRDMNVLDFLRDVGKNTTINYMLAKESVKKRLDLGISFTEFSYQLLQAYDFLCLFRQYDCTLQMGGSDQWGNITAGAEFIRKTMGMKAYAITTPLLTKSDGSKFGKSAKGNIWLDPEMTSPYQFYQFWINADDADIPNFIRYFSLLSKEEVESLEDERREDPRELKKILARDLTIRIHSEEDYNSVLQVTNLLFNKNATKDQLLSMPLNALESVSKEIPSYEVPLPTIQNGTSITDLVTEHCSIFHSKSDVRRSIKNHALSLNKEKISTHDFPVNHEYLLKGKFMMIENGRKNKYMIIVK